MSTAGDAKRAFGIAPVLATASLWLMLALLVLFLRRMPPTAVIDALPATNLSLLAGLLAGLALAGLQLALLRFWPRWRGFTTEVVRDFDVSMSEVVAIGGAVAFAEELLFRAALQPVLGLWLAAALFTAVHVRFDRASWRRETRNTALVAVASLYLAGLAFGILFERGGLLAAMLAHFVYDLIVLQRYRLLRPR